MAAVMPLVLVSLSVLAQPIVVDGQEPKELQGILLPEPKPIDYAELAGLPSGSRPEVLTIEQVYTLALV